MEHIKIHHAKVVTAGDKTFVIEGPLPADQLRKMEMHPSLDAFVRLKEQHEALIEIAELIEGRIIVARDEQVIIGYVTFHYPDELRTMVRGRHARSDRRARRHRGC